MQEGANYGLFGKLIRLVETCGELRFDIWPYSIRT